MTCSAIHSTMPSNMPIAPLLSQQGRMALSVPSAVREEGRYVGHDETQTVKDRPSDDDPLEPSAAFVHGAAAAGEVHQQQRHRCGDNGGDSGDQKDLIIDVLHNLISFLPNGGGKNRLAEHGGHGRANNGRV